MIEVEYISKLSDPTFIKPAILEKINSLDGILSNILTNPRLYHDGPLMREVIFPSDEAQGLFMDFLEKNDTYFFWDIMGNSIFLEDVPAQGE